MQKRTADNGKDVVDGVCAAGSHNRCWTALGSAGGGQERAGRNIKDIVDDGYGLEWATRSAGRHWEQDRRAKACAQCAIGAKCGGAGHVGRQDGGRRWEAADRAAGTAGCGGMWSGLADPRREGNDRETPEEARVGCDGPQEWLEGSASWGGQWGQVAGNGGLRQHGEWVGRPKRAGHDGGWSMVGAGSGQQRERQAATARGAGWLTQKRRDTRDTCLCEVLAGCDRPRGRREHGGKREVRGGKPDWVAGGRGAVEAEVVVSKEVHITSALASPVGTFKVHKHAGTVGLIMSRKGAAASCHFRQGGTAQPRTNKQRGAASGQARARKLPKSTGTPLGFVPGEDP
ncbi:hypothetical protein B0H10DRAFT_1954982 [Mycena sp. CBHHK59/15]|nr:hypothetical protein B0H10DRAFT_1954982 [Mycena sp. CBHHK59/15]